MKRVHVVGTGTIGEPLIGLLAMHKEAFGIDEVTFHKNSARIDDRPKLNQMIAKGARLAVTDGKQGEFKELGHEVAYESEEAIRQADVVIDCTPSGVGIDNKNKFYQKYSDRVKASWLKVLSSVWQDVHWYQRRGTEPNDQFLHIVSYAQHRGAA